MSPPFIQVFRIHDIEKTAKPELLRSLFDTICGKEIEGLSHQIDDAVQELTLHRSRMVSVAEKIAALTREDGPLRQYARRKHDYDVVNKPEIQEQYQQIDEAGAAESIADSADESWEEVWTALDLDSNAEQIREWFGESRAAVLQPQNTDDTTADGEPSAETYRPLCQPIATAIEGSESEGDDVTTADTRILKAIENVQNECGKVTAALHSAKEVVVSAHRESREVLEDKGFPTGSAERQTKRRRMRKPNLT